MNELLDRLGQLQTRPLHTVVHLGAGPARELQLYAELKPLRLHLVDGEPDVAADLRRHVRGLAGAEVHECVVAATAGAASWHRFNVARFNGLSALSELATPYPRLRCSEVVDVPARAAVDLLGPFAPAEPSDQRASALLVDIGPAGDDLIVALPDDLAHAFNWVLLRRCRVGPEALGRAATLQSRMEQACYRQLPSAEDPTSPWSTLVFVLDRNLLLQRRLRGRIASLQAQLTEATAFKAEAHRLRREVDDLGRERLALARASVARNAALLAERDDLVNRLEIEQRRAQALETEVEQLQARSVERDHELARLRQLERDAMDRQTLVQREMARAEGQIALLRQMLLGERSA
jgi:hypothetical protein